MHRASANDWILIPPQAHLFKRIYTYMEGDYWRKIYINSDRTVPTYNKRSIILISHLRKHTLKFMYKVGTKNDREYMCGYDTPSKSRNSSSSRK